MEHIEELPPEIVLRILVNFQDTAFLFLLYKHVPYVRELVHANPKVLFSESGILHYRYNDALLYSVVQTPSTARYHVAIEYMLLGLDARVYPETYQALLAMIPQVVVVPTKLRLKLYMKRIIRRVVGCGWVHQIAPLCALFKLRRSQQVWYQCVAAIVGGNVAFFSECMKNWRFKYRKQFLVVAIRHNQLAIVMMLTERQKLDFSDGHEFLQTAARYGCLETFQYILGQIKQTFSGFCDEFVTSAMCNQQPTMVEYLLGTKIPMSTDIKTAILLWATKYGHTAIVKMLVYNNPQIDVSIQGNLPVYQAVSKGHIEIVRFLFSLDTIKSAKETNKLLVCASGCNCVAIVAFLLQTVKVDPSINKHEAMRVAVRNGHDGIVEMLMEYTTAQHLSLVLKIAVENGHMRIIRRILAMSKTALSYDYVKLCSRAVHKNQGAVVYFLLANGYVDLHFDMYIFLYAAATGQWKIIRYLVEKKCDVNPGNVYKALMTATEDGLTKTVDFLSQLLYSNIITHLNDAFQVAVENGHAGIVRLLLATDKVTLSHPDILRIVFKQYNAGILRQCLDMNWRLILNDINMSRLACDAAMQGDTDILEILFNLYDINPALEENKLLNLAVTNGQYEVVELLLKTARVAFVQYDDRLIQLAVAGGYVSIVQLLLGHAPKLYDAFTLIWIAMHKNWRMVLNVIPQ